jgi:DNA-binding transcriptional ArsR family regulator
VPTRTRLALSIRQAAQLFRYLSEESRLQILLLLAARDELSVTALVEATGQAQPAVSHQLTLLRLGQVVVRRRVGKRNFYRLASEHVRQLLAVVSG